MNEDEIIDVLVRFANELQPKHKYRDEHKDYEKDDVEVAYCSRYHAKCGPRHGGMGFSINQEYINTTTPESFLRLLTHELVHLSIGTGYNDPGHPPEFWVRFGEYANRVLANWSDYDALFAESLRKGVYIDECIDDPNPAMVDRRSETSYEAQAKIAHTLGCVPDERIDGLGNTVVYSSSDERNATKEEADSFTFEFTPMKPEDLLKWTRKHSDALSAGKNSWVFEPPYAEKYHGRVHVDPELAPGSKEEEHVRASALYYYAQNNRWCKVYIESEDIMSFSL